MSFRNRPVLDRKHRPRWQDELRTQQLIVAGFALAIAVAIGIFGAAAWNTYFDASLRQVALVDGTPVTASTLQRRANILYAQLGATALDLQGQLGGAKDQAIQQQLQGVNDASSQVQSLALDSLKTGIVLDARQAQDGVTVSDDELDAEVENRRTHPERKKLSLILVAARPAEGAAEGSEPTEEDWAAAREKADQILAEVKGGAEFATLAAERSDDATKQFNGLLGWIEAGDPLFGPYFDAAGDTPAGEVIGPTRNEQGWFLLRVDAVKAAGRDAFLDDLLAQAGVSEADYRAYVRGELLQGAYREYFSSTVVGRYQPQRKVAQIQLTNETGAPVAQVLVRHLLVQPIPGAQSQADATEAQWAAALTKAEKLHAEAVKPDANWWVLAEQSDDPGSKTRGGSLGWYDPASSSFVQDFKDAIAQLRVGEVSEPVKTEFGYHVIQVVEDRITVAGLADRLVQELRADPDSFADVARDLSEDTATAKEGGELGWVIHYQFDGARDTAIFDLTEAGQISEPVVSSGSTYIFKLLDSSPARFVPDSQREQVGGTGFSTWLAQIQDQAGVWVDPQLSPASSVG
jgi:peptidyl-prolyl cis-trans isomerase SurA